MGAAYQLWGFMGEDLIFVVDRFYPGISELFQAHDRFAESLLLAGYC